MAQDYVTERKNNLVDSLGTVIKVIYEEIIKGANNTTSNQEKNAGKTLLL